MIGLYDLLAINARTHPQRTAVISPDGTSFAYSELSARINALSHALSKRGIGAGVRVGIMLKNGVEFIETLYAAFKLGAVAVPFSYAFLNREVIDALRISGCEAFVFDQSLACDFSLIKNESPQVRWWIAHAQAAHAYDFALDYQLLLDAGDLYWSKACKRVPDEDELMLFTSGTTGAPKCVVHSHESALMFFSLAMMAGSEFKPSDTMLYYAPLYHLAGISYLFYLMSLGGTLVLMASFSASGFLENIQRHRIAQVFLIPPTLINRIYKEAKGASRKFALESVRWVIMSGGANNIDCARRVFELFPNAAICNTYGQTERAANTILYLTREQFLQDPSRAASVGRATQFSEIKLVDAEGKESKEGEAYARCPGMLRRYLSGEQAFTSDGWFATGDILRENGGGYLYFIDRSKDMIKSGGENVFSLEVEGVIAAMPSVAECAVFGLPDAHFDEVVSAAIVVKPGCTCTEEDVTAWCRARMANFKRPHNVFFVNNLPRNSVGKIQKEELRRFFSESF